MAESNHYSVLVDEYISEFAPDVQVRLQALRQIIRESAPNAEEKISYKMPRMRSMGIWFISPHTSIILGFTLLPVESWRSRRNSPSIKERKDQYSFRWISHCLRISSAGLWSFG